MGVPGGGSVSTFGGGWGWGRGVSVWLTPLLPWPGSSGD